MGDNCKTDCPAVCSGDFGCGQDNGNCVKCKDTDFVGLKCDTCKDGRYGLKCNSQCSDNCLNGAESPCGRTDGKCVDGCKPGHFGADC
jgi:hypothetical protein